MNWRIPFFAVILSVSGLLFSDEPAAATGTPGKRVLLLNSHDSSNIELNRITDEITHHFRSRKLPVRWDVIELSILRNPAILSGGALPKLLERIDRNNYDLILTVGNAATNAILENHALLEKNIPLVFTAINDDFHKKNADYPFAVGAIIPDLAIPNLNLGLKLLPDTRKILVLNNSTPYGMIAHRDVQAAAKKFPNVAITSLNAREHSTEEMLRTVAALPPQSFIIYNGWNSTAPDPFEPNSSFIAKINDANFNIPILTASEYFSASPAVIGGIMVDYSRHGLDTATIIQRIFDGERPERITPATGRLQCLLDGARMHKYQIAVRNIPHDATILNLPLSFWKRNSRWLFCGMIALLGSSLLFSVVMMLRNRRARQFEVIFTSLPVSVVVVDAAGRLHFSSGLNTRNRARRQPRELRDLSPELQVVFENPLRQVFATGAPMHFEYELQGRRRRADLFPIGKNVFGIETVMWVSVDNHELYAANQVGIELAERLRLTLESIGEGVIVANENGVITLANPSAARIIGIAAAELSGRRLSDVYNRVGCRDGQPIASPLASQLKTAGSIAEPGEVIDLITSSGKKLHITETATPIRAQNGDTIGLVLVFRDITGEFESRKQLQFQNSVWKQAGDIANLIYFRREADGKFLWSENGGKYWPIKQGAPCPAAEWVLPEDYENFMAVWSKVITGEIRETTISYRAGRADAPRFYEMHVGGMEGLAPHISCSGVIQDVTLQHEREQHHHDTTTLLAGIMDNLPGMIFVKDADDDFHYRVCNNAFCRIHGKIPSEIINRSDREIYSDPTVAEQILEFDRHAMTAAAPVANHLRFVTADGNKHVMHTIRSVFKRADGTALLLGISLDVTELEQRRDEMVAGNLILNAILDHLPAMVTVKDPDNHFRYTNWNKLAESIYGINAADAIGHNEIELKNLHPNFPDLYGTKDLEVLGGKTVDLETGIIAADGAETALQIKKMLLPLPGGRNLIMTLGVDVTGQKRNERRLTTTGKTLQAYVHQERLVNACLETIIMSSEDEVAMRNILRIVGSKLQIDFCHIRRYDFTARRIVPVAEYQSAKFAPILFPVEGIPFDPDTEARLRKFSENEVFFCPGTESGELLPPELCGHELDSVWAVELRKDDATWGFLELCRVAGAAPKSGELNLTERKMIHAAGHIVEILLERQGTRRDLERSESEKQQIFDNINMPVVIFDRTGAFIRANRAAYEVYNTSEAECLTQPCYRIFCKKSEMPAGCPVRKVINTRTEHRVEVHIGEHHYLMTTRPVFDAAGNLDYVLETAVDITDLKRQEAQLRSAMESAKAADRAKSGFIAGMSHELRTPLNAVIGYSELLAAGGQSEVEIKDSAKAIGFAGNTLLKLLNDLLDMALLESGRLAIVKTPVDFAAVLEELMTLYRDPANQNQTELTLRLPDRLPELELDKPRIRQVLLNLLGNAVKFTRQGAVDIAVGFTVDAAVDATQPPAGTLTITIHDHGEGLPEAQTGKVNAAVDAGPDERIFAGAGLNLAICKRLVDRMGGTLHTTSDGARATTTTVVLHNVAIHAVPVPVTAALRVVLVDDVPINLRVLEAMMKRWKLDCLSCSSGEMALERINAEGASLVITDLWMPGISGDTLARKLAENPATAHIPVVVVTADTQIDPPTRELFQEVIFKPITIEKLKDVVDRHLKLS